MSNNRQVKVFRNSKELIIEKLLDSTSLKKEELISSAKIAETFNIDLMQAIALTKFIRSQYDFESDYNRFIWNIYKAETTEDVIKFWSKETDKLIKEYTNEQQT